MKRLVRKSEYIPSVGDIVIFKNHPYDKLSYEIKQVFPDDTVFMENDSNAYTGISFKSIKPLKEEF